MTCPICSAEQVFLVQTLYDDRYGYPGRFELFHCRECGHSFLRNEFGQEDLVKLYTQYYPRREYDSTQQQLQRNGPLRAWWHGERRSAFRWVDRPGRVLDIGCGAGQSLAYLRAKGCEVRGVEADEESRAFAVEQGFEIDAGTFNPQVYEPEEFDYVTMDQVIEHMIDPIDALRGVASILKPGGKLIMSTPNASGWGRVVFGARWINWHAPYHLNFFSRDSMRRACNEVGLQVERVAVVTPATWLAYQWRHILSYPDEGEASIFWQGGKSWRFRRRLAEYGLRKSHSLGVDHIITRFFDLVGVGDNVVFVVSKNT